MKVNRYNFLVVLLLSLSIICFSSCDDDECFEVTNPLCENYDPCWDWVEPDFEMGTIFQFPSSSLKYEGDTVLFGRVYFEAKIEDAISYEWKIGTDVRTWNDKEFFLFFDDDDSTLLRNNPIRVQLIIQRTPNTTCKSDDDGIDTLSRYLHFRSQWEAALWGVWKGYRDDLTDEIYRVNFQTLRDPNFFDAVYDEYIFNLYNEGQDCYHEIAESGSFVGFRKLIFGGQGRPENGEECGSPYKDTWTREFEAIVNNTANSITISWLEVGRDDNGNCCYEIPHTFYGHRVE